MATKNSVTGDSIISRPNTKAFDDAFDRIFGKTKEPAPEAKDDEKTKEPEIGNSK